MRRRLGLALGGGAGRGVAHVGVLKCLAAEGIRPDLVVGTSIGAFVGSVYASGWSVERILAWAREIVDSAELHELGFEVFADSRKDFSTHRMSLSFKERFVFARMALSPFVTKRETLRQLIDRFIPDAWIADLPKRFACTTLDLVTGEMRLIQSGSLRDAVMRSISIAGVFPPFEENSAILVDAGPTSNVPVDACRELGARTVVAVNLKGTLSKYRDGRSALATSMRADEIATFYLNKQEALRADVLIEPRVESIHWADFRQLERGIALGEEATRPKLPELRRALTPRPLRPILRLAGWLRGNLPERARPRAASAEDGKPRATS